MRIQRLLIGQKYTLQLERVLFYPTITDQAIKIGRHWSGVGRLSRSGVNVAVNSDIIRKIKDIVSHYMHI